MPPPRYSILIASRNEGDLLRSTLDDVVMESRSSEFEVVVVDDASDDGSADFLRDAPYGDLPLRVVANAERTGLIHSRARAADCAEGEYLVFIDAHVAVSPGWLDALRRRLVELGDRGIATPLVYPLERRGWTIERHKVPQVGCSVVNPFLDFGWVDPVAIDGHICTCAIGGMAWMTSREWYRHLGGLDAEMAGWGGENIDLPLRTWAAGGWCVVSEEAEVGHLYKRGRPREPVDGAVLAVNKLRAAHSIFTRPTLERLLENLAPFPVFLDAMRALEERPGQLAALQDRAEAIRCRGDRWLIDTFRLPLFEEPRFYCPREPPRTPSSLRRARTRSVRPPVSVLAIAPEGNGASALVESLLERTAYTNCDVLLVVDGANCGDARAPAEHPRLRKVDVDSGDGLDCLGMALAGSEYAAFLDAGTAVAGEHWIEEFILLFERHPRLVLACPRTRWLQAGGAPSPDQPDSFDCFWDWSAPGFARVRQGRPLAETPYQAFSVPPAALFLRTAHFLRLGGFDRTYVDLAGKVRDFSIRAWLHGYEVYCHPGITFDRVAPPREGDSARATRVRRELAQVLPAVKYFTNMERIDACRRLSPLADRLYASLLAFRAADRKETLREARFDDDWLFFKFGIPEAGRPVPRAPARSHGTRDERQPPWPTSA